VCVCVCVLWGVEGTQLLIDELLMKSVQPTLQLAREGSIGGGERRMAALEKVEEKRRGERRRGYRGRKRRK